MQEIRHYHNNRYMKWSQKFSIARVLRLEPFITNKKPTHKNAWVAKMEGRKGLRGGAVLLADNPIQGIKGIYKLTVEVTDRCIASYVGMSMMMQQEKSVEERVALHGLSIMGRPLNTEASKLINQNHMLKDREAARLWFCSQDFQCYQALHTEFFRGPVNQLSKKAQVARIIIEKGITNFALQEKFWNSKLHIQVFPVGISDDYELNLSAIKLLESIALLEDRLFQKKKRIELNTVDEAAPDILSKKIDNFKKNYLATKSKNNFSSLFKFLSETQILKIARAQKNLIDS